MRTLFLTLLLTSMIGGALGAVLFHGTPVGVVTKIEQEEEYDPCNDPNVYCGRLRVPGG